MRQCPACNRTYEDTQQFCVQDGTPLVGPAPQAAQGPPPPPSWGPTPPPSAPKKRKIWPWVLGGLVLLVGGGILLIAIVLGVAYKLSDTNTATSNVRTNTNARTSTTPDEGPPVDTSNTELYVNSPDEFTGTLAANYVDFSFRYPKTWKLDPDPAPSFVRVERANAAGNTIENFSVGWFAVTGGSGSGAGNTALLSQVINNLSSQVSGNFPNYQKIGEGATTVGRYSGYELRFGGAAGKGTPQELPYWGRIVIIPDPNGSKNGVSLIMLTTGHSKEIKSQADVGEKGELPVILKTFRIGPTPGATSTTNKSTSTNANTGDDEEEQ
jgi:hypothetical protein